MSATRIYGTLDNGNGRAVQLTAEGHTEVEIHGPILPFGSVHAESATPIFQVDPVYGLNTSQMVATTGSGGSTTATGGLFTVSTGTTSGAQAALQSRKRLRYRPGQGVLGRFTAMWPNTAAQSISVAGLGTAESGFYFGYYNGVVFAPSYTDTSSEFGILHVTGGVRAIYTLTVTTASTSTQPYQIVLNGATAVSVTATNNGSTVKTAYEISRGTYPGWTAEQIGSTVVFLANAAGPKAGTYSVAQSGAGTPTAGTFATTLAGVNSTDTFIPQSRWNGPDTLNGSGSSGVTLDPTKLNIFQIGVQYLGAGPVQFSVEVNPAGNNPTFVTVHTLDFPNRRTTPSVSQPSFPFTMAVYSAGSTTNVSLSSASVAGFVEGQIVNTGPRLTYSREAGSYVGSTAGTYYPLFTVRNSSTFGGRANQAVINLLSVASAHGDNTPVTLYLIKNATLTGTPNFSQWAAIGAGYVDSAATGCTFSTNDQLILAMPMGNGSNAILQFTDSVSIQPGETITVAARAVTGTTTWVVADLNTREDQ